MIINQFKHNQQSSIQQNYARHIQAMKILNSSSKAYQKISKSYFGIDTLYLDIKANILAISQALQHAEFFPSISHGSAKTTLQFYCQTNSSIADHCKEYSLQLSNLYTMYTEMAKQHYSKYKEEKNNLNHYLNKVKALSNKQEESDRFQRNQDKLKSAKNSYAKRSKQLNVFLAQTNDEVSKIWQKNFIGMISVFTKKYSQTLQDVHSMLESNDSEQIILDEEDFELHMSPKNSFKSLTKYEHLHEKVEKLLCKAPLSSRTNIVDLFKLNTKNNIQTTKASLNSTNKVQKLFGIKSPTNKIGQQLNLDGYGKSEPQNNFSCFQNILSEKNKSQPPSIALSFSDFNLISETTIPSQQPSKDTSFSLIDL